MWLPGDERRVEVTARRDGVSCPGNRNVLALRHWGCLHNIVNRLKFTEF